MTVRTDARREATVQQLDPVVASAGWSMVLGAALFSTAYALLDTVLGWDGRWALGVLPMLLLIGGYAAFVVLARLRAHVVRRTEHLGVVSVLLLAAIVDLVSRPAEFDVPGSSWGPFAVGIALLVLGLYRPPPELLVSTGAAVVLVGAASAWVARDAVGSGAFAIFILQSIAPIAILGAAGSVFARVAVRMIRLWEAQAKQESLSEYTALRPGIERSVLQERVSLLNGAVVPLYSDIVESGRITDADIATASAAANALRSLLVAEADRSWLQSLVLQDGVASDPSQRAARIPLPVRPGLRALVNAMRGAPGYSQGSLTVDVGSGDPIEVSVTARGEWARRRIDRALSPYIAVLRGEAGNVSVHRDSASVSVRFTCHASH